MLLCWEKHVICSFHFLDKLFSAKLFISFVANASIYRIVIKSIKRAKIFAVFLQIFRKDLGCFVVFGNLWFLIKYCSLPEKEEKKEAVKNCWSFLCRDLLFLFERILIITCQLIPYAAWYLLSCSVPSHQNYYQKETCEKWASQLEKKRKRSS